MKLFLEITLLISLFSAAASLKAVANENGGNSESSLRAGSRRMDETCDSIMDIVCKLQNTKTFCAMVTEGSKTYTEFGDKLSGGKPYTVFAPTDEAFKNIEDQFLRLKPEEIYRTIQFHFYEDVVLTNTDLECQLKLTSLTGETSRVKCVRKEVGIYTKYQRGRGNKDLGNYPMIDIKSKEACSGIIHRVDQVMLPIVFEPFKESLPETLTPEIEDDDEEEEPEDTPAPTPTRKDKDDEEEEEEPEDTPAPTPTRKGKDDEEEEEDDEGEEEEADEKPVLPFYTDIGVAEDAAEIGADKYIPGTQIEITEVTSVQDENSSKEAEAIEEKKKPRIGALGINLIIFSTLLLCFVFVCMRR